MFSVLGQSGARGSRLKSVQIFGVGTLRFQFGARDAGNESWNDPEKNQPPLVSFKGIPGSFPHSLIPYCAPATNEETLTCCWFGLWVEKPPLTVHGPDGQTGPDAPVADGPVADGPDGPDGCHRPGPDGLPRWERSLGAKA